MAKFTIATPAGPSYGVAGGAYDLEREGMGSLDAEILEIPAGTEDEFIAAARNADALYAKGRSITKRMIDGMERCKIMPEPAGAATTAALLSGKVRLTPGSPTVAIVSGGNIDWTP